MRKVARHFLIDIREDSFTRQRKQQKIIDEAAVDRGLRVRTSRPPGACPPSAPPVESYNPAMSPTRRITGRGTAPHLDSRRP